MDSGELVPDSVTNEMVKDRLTHADTANGFPSGAIAYEFSKCAPRELS